MRADARPGYWGTVHHPVEDVGLGTVHARIAFHPPEELGFSAGALERPGVAAIVDHLDLLLDAGDLPGASGWCTLPDGCGYVAIRTELPGVTGEMIDWWFDWHPHDRVRYSRLRQPGIGVIGRAR